MKNSKTISNPENVRSSFVALFPLPFHISSQQLLEMGNDHKKWLCGNDSISSPLKQSWRLTNEPPEARCWAPSSSAVWCTQYTGSLFPPSPLCTHRTSLCRGIEKVPPALSDGREKKKHKENTRWLSGQMQEAMSLANVHPVWITHLRRTIRWMSHQTGSWAFHIFFFIPLSPTLPGGLKFPGWSSTNLFRSSLQYFYFIVAKKKLSPILLVKTLPMRCLAASRGRAGGRVEGLGQRHQGDDSPLVARDLLAIGLSSNREEMMGTTSDLDLMTQGKHSDRQAESSFNYTGPPLQRAKCNWPMENHLPGQLGFPTTEIQQGNKGSPAARSPTASGSHGDSESLQAGVRVGRQKLLTGWLLAGHVRKDEDGKISNKEESEHGSS